MDITIEQIEELRDRINVSYEEAKKALDKSNGDILEAIIIIENPVEEKEINTKKKANKNEFKWDKDLIGLFNYYIGFKKQGEEKLAIPICLLGLGLVFASELVIITIIIAIISKYKIYFYKER